MPYVIKATELPSGPFWVTTFNFERHGLSKSSVDAAKFTSEVLAKLTMGTVAADLSGAVVLLIDSETNETVGTCRND